ncbi:MAG TPA: aminoacyl-tRNA hydrolase [Methylocella sp.]|nr:aminoacyl-tRNA hydrolase [Methylocella sp.]
MFLFTGLGNPGKAFASNRHNIGFMAIDAIAHAYHPFAFKARFQASISEIFLSNERVLLLKPQTYMNESGRAVGEAARYLKILPSQIIVFHDELDLPPGRIRVKRGGGNAGHNGLKSITAHIGNDYRRVRIGIGHPGDKALVHDYVLNDFSKADVCWIAPLMDAIAQNAGLLVAGSEGAFQREMAKLFSVAPDGPEAGG